MSFKFKMERVLNYKETIEDHKKSEFGTAQENLNYEEKKLNEINQYKENLKKEKNLSANNTNAGSLSMYHNYINDLELKIKSQEEVVAKSQEEVEEAKDEMVEAVREKKMFEKLKEKEYEEHLYEEQKKEEELVDTIVTYNTSMEQ